MLLGSPVCLRVLQHSIFVQQLKTAPSLPGAVKDSVVGEERVARYLLTVLNARSAHLRWKSEVHFSGISDSQSLIRSLLFIIAHVTRESLAQIIWSPEHFFQCLKHEWSKKHHGILL